MRFEGVSFNMKKALSFEDENEFSSHRSYQHLWPKLSDDQRKTRLIQAYNLMLDAHDSGYVEVSKKSRHR